VACACVLTGSFWQLLFKRRTRIFPLYTAPVVRCVVTPAATALRLLPRGSATAGEVGALTQDAPGRVSAVSLRVSEALAALALQRTFGATYESTDTRRPQLSVIGRTLDNPGPRATDTMKCGGRAVLGVVLVTTAGTQLRDPWT